MLIALGAVGLRVRIHLSLDAGSWKTSMLWLVPQVIGFVLPQGFVRIRHFGFLANRRRTTLLPLCFQLLGSTPEPPAEKHPSSTEDATDLYRRPNCGGPMKVIERLTAAEIQLRSPPTVTVAA